MMFASASSPSKAPKILMVIGAVLLIAVLVLSARGSASATPQEATSSPTASAAPAGNSDPTAPACEPAYTQIAVGNEGGRVIDDFEVRYAAATTEANNLSDAQRSLLIEESGKNAQTLAAWAHAFGLLEDPNNWKSLVADDCLSPEGQKLHSKLDGALSATGSTFEEAEAPADGFNSGVDDGIYGVSSEAGVRGDRKAIKVTLSDGTVTYIMVRCGNPVYPGKPDLPNVPTDNPPPVEPPVVTPPPTKPPVDTPKCPWNPALPPDSPKCLQPKSKNPDDYRQPGDGGKGPDVGTGTKPPAPVTPVQPAPEPVQTEAPGGGGIIDTPTKPPGSETGVTAPGATPPPTQAPTTPPPPNEGGDNDGVIDEGF